MTQIPVAFRLYTPKGMPLAPAGPPEVTAIFTSRRINPARHAGHRVCYAHVGQHSECSIEWVLKDTRPATKAEYAALLRELRQIYNTDGDTLVIRQRVRR